MKTVLDRGVSGLQSAGHNAAIAAIENGHVTALEWLINEEKVDFGRDDYQPMRRTGAVGTPAVVTFLSCLPARLLDPRGLDVALRSARAAHRSDIEKILIHAGASL
jgi:hypothetical protein